MDSSSILTPPSSLFSLSDSLKHAYPLLHHSLPCTSSSPSSSISLLPLWVADMDFPVAPAIQSAIATRIETAVYGYTFVPNEFKTAVKDWYLKKHEILINEEEIYRTSGVLKSLAVCLNVWSKENDWIMIFTPVYQAFFNVIENNDRKVLQSELKREGDTFYIDWDDVHKKIKEFKPKIFLFCSPHNPVGRVWTPFEITKMVKICEENDILFISDEIFMDVTFSPYAHQCALKFGNKKNTIVFSSASKAFNMPGLECAWTVIQDKEMMSKFRKKAEAFGILDFLTNSFGCLATISALKSSDSWLNDCNSYIYENYLFIKNYLAEKIKKIQISKLEGCFVILCDYSQLELTEEQFFQQMDKIRLVLEPGSKYRCDWKVFRINLGCDRKMLEEAMKRIQESFKGEKLGE